MKMILELSEYDAGQFLLKEKSYVNFLLPPYFSFENILSRLSFELITTEHQTIKDFFKRQDQNNPENLKTENPKFYDEVNYLITSNKNGYYDWRPFQIINPFLYVYLVHEITKTENWKLIQENFCGEYTEKIICESIPIISEDDNIKDSGAQISKWVSKVEKESIKLAVQYKYIFETDILNCYGSIYTHSFSWALHGKKYSKKNRQVDNLGKKIDDILMSMSNGQTNGIPQGSVLMDFFAEIILNYADKEIFKRILNDYDYKIIRYRDDYKIFVNNKNIGEEILMKISQVLSELGMKLNAEKTKNSEDIILSSIKKDKMALIENRSIHDDCLQTELLFIYSFSKKYSNSGSLEKLLKSFYKKISKETLTAVIESYNYDNDEDFFNNYIEILIAIIVNIVIKNPRVYATSSLLLSTLANEITDDSRMTNIIDNILNKFDKIPNTELFEVWIQRMLIKKDNYGNYKNKFDFSLAKIVDNENLILWNNDWLRDDMQKIFIDNKITNKEVLNEMDENIQFEEIDMYSVYE